MRATRFKEGFEAFIVQLNTIFH